MKSTETCGSESYSNNKSRTTASTSPVRTTIENQKTFVIAQATTSKRARTSQKYLINFLMPKKVVNRKLRANYVSQCDLNKDLQAVIGEVDIRKKANMEVK